MWTARHLVQASCSELTLKNGSFSKLLSFLLCPFLWPEKIWENWENWEIYFYRKTSLEWDSSNFSNLFKYVSKYKRLDKLKRQIKLQKIFGCNVIGLEIEGFLRSRLFSFFSQKKLRILPGKEIEYDIRFTVSFMPIMRWHFESIQPFSKYLGMYLIILLLFVQL